jgi:hypothetical protein
MIARAWGDNPIEALCLAQSGPFKRQYVTGGRTCESWASGHHGAVDEPPDYGEQVRAMYAAELSSTDVSGGHDLKITSEPDKQSPSQESQ